MIPPGRFLSIPLCLGLGLLFWILAVVGLNNFVMVEVNDGRLVAERGKAEGGKKIFESLKEKGRSAISQYATARVFILPLIMLIVIR